MVEMTAPITKLSVEPSIVRALAWARVPAWALGAGRPVGPGVRRAPGYKELMILRQGSCPKHEKPVCFKSFSCGDNVKVDHKSDILLILKSLEISEDEPVAQTWLSLAEGNSDYNLAKRTHRSALAAPRQYDNDFLESFNSMEDIFNSILDRVKVHYLTYIELLDSLLLKPVPVKEDIDLLLNNIPQNNVTMSYFFNKLNSHGWLKPLREAGFFKRPPELVLNDKDGTIYSHVWPESNYLSRMAKCDPNEVVDIFINDVPIVKNSWVLQDLADAALNMSPDLSSQLVDKIEYWVQAIYPLQMPRNFSRVIIHNAKGGKIDCALGLAKILFEIMPDPRTRNGSLSENRYFIPNPTTRFEVYDYGQLIRDVFPELIVSADLRAFELLCDILDSALTLSRTDSDRNVRSWSIHLSGVLLLRAVAAMTVICGILSYPLLRVSRTNRSKE